MSRTRKIRRSAGKAQAPQLGKALGSIEEALSSLRSVGSFEGVVADLLTHTNAVETLAESLTKDYEQLLSQFKDLEKRVRDLEGRRG